jgi:hypothetical protein
MCPYPGTTTNLVYLQFVRFASDDHRSTVIASLIQLFDREWKLHEPRLIISIIGCYHKYMIFNETERAVIREAIFDVRTICNVFF